MERTQLCDSARATASSEEYALNGPDFERLLGRVHASLDAERGLKAALRARPTGVRLLLVATTVALVVGGTLVFAPPVGMAAFLSWRLALNAATYAGLLVLVSNLVLRPLHRRAASVSFEMAVVAAGFLAPFGWAWAPLPLLTRAVAPAASGRNCLAVGIALGTALVGLFRALDRAPQTNLRRAALFATGAGLFANLTLVFHCPQTRPLHLALMHAPSGLVILLAYGTVCAGLGRRRST